MKYAMGDFLMCPPENMFMEGNDPMTMDNV